MMTHTELKQAILDYIKCIYDKEYIGGLTIEDIDPIGYKVSFDLNKSENPFVLISDLPDTEFLEFVKKELRKSKLIKTKYYSITKLPPQKY